MTVVEINHIAVLYLQVSICVAKNQNGLWGQCVHELYVTFVSLTLSHIDVCHFILTHVLNACLPLVNISSNQYERCIWWSGCMAVFEIKRALFIFFFCLLNTHKKKIRKFNSWKLLKSKYMKTILIWKVKVCYMPYCTALQSQQYSCMHQILF